jgi:hypothetical protein
LGLREGRSDDDGRRHRCSLGVGCRLLRGSGRNLRRSQRRGAREASRPKATPAEQAPRVRGWCENCAVVAVFGPGKSRGRHFGQSSRRSRSRPPPKSDPAGSEPAPYPKGGGRYRWRPITQSVNYVKGRMAGAAPIRANPQSVPEGRRPQGSVTAKARNRDRMNEAQAAGKPQPRLSRPWWLSRPRPPWVGGVCAESTHQALRRQG